MKLALGIIAAALLAAAVGGAFVLRGGEYVMFLMALGIVTFFGALPVVLGVLTRPRKDTTGRHEDTVVVIDRAGPAPGAPAPDPPRTM